MKISSKKIVVALTTCASVFSIAACGKKNSNTSGYSSFSGDPTQLSAHITFWHTMGQENREILDGMIAEFNEHYPNIEVEHASQGGYDDIKTKISAAIPAGTTPTMAFCYPDHVAEYMSSGAIEEMSGYVTDSKIGLSTEAWDSPGGEGDFIAKFWEEGKSYGPKYGIDGGLYSVPYSKSTEVLFYDKTTFEAKGWKVPTTWSEMEDIMAKAVAAGYKYGLGYDSDANLLITRMEQEGIPYTTAEGDDNFLFNNDDAKGLVRQMKTWFDNKWLITSGTSANSSYTSEFFTKGETPMTIGSTGGTRYNYFDGPEIGVAPLPAGSQNNHIISQGPSICFFSRASQEERFAAWLFYKWITNTQNSALYATLTGYSPVRSSSFKDPYFVEFVDDVTTTGKDALFQKTLAFNVELEDRYFVSPAFKGSSTARTEMDGIMANVLLGTKTVDQAFDDALTNCLFAG